MGGGMRAGAGDWSSWLIGSWRTIGFVAGSAALIYLSVVLSVRFLGQRRTLAQMTIFDFAVAVALGTIVGRTATTARPSYVQGITAALTLLVVHNAVSWLRLRMPASRQWFGRSPITLVVDGSIDTSALRRAHLTPDDLYTALRERGVSSLADVQLALLESRGAFSVITNSAGGADLWPVRVP